MDSRWLVAPLLSTIIAMSIHADVQNWDDDYEDEVEEIAYEDEEDDSFFVADNNDNAKEASNPSPSDPYPSQTSSGEMFVSAMPTLENEWGVIIDGDWLYWRPDEEGFEYGLQSVNNTDEPPFDTANIFGGVRGRVSKITPSYSSGYRLSLDLKLPHDSWDLSGIWTRYQNSHHNRIEAKPEQIVWPLYLNDNYIPKAISAKAKLELNYTVLDVELARSFFVAKHLSIRPFVGFAAAWVQQIFTIDYVDVTVETCAIPPMLIPSIHSHNHNKFNGYGMSAGCDTKWPLAWGFSLEGDLYAALLYAKTDVRQFETLSDGNPRTRLKDGLHSLIPVVKLFGGISWEKQFCNEKCYFNLHGGWEEQVWFKCNHTEKNINGSLSNVGAAIDRQGNLTLSGWTLGAKFGF